MSDAVHGSSESISGSSGYIHYEHNKPKNLKGKDSKTEDAAAVTKQKEEKTEKISIPVIHSISELKGIEWIKHKLGRIKWVPIDVGTTKEGKEGKVCYVYASIDALENKLGISREQILALRKEETKYKRKTAVGTLADEKAKLIIDTSQAILATTKKGPEALLKLVINPEYQKLTKTELLRSLQKAHETLVESEPGAEHTQNLEKITKQFENIVSLNQEDISHTPTNEEVKAIVESRSSKYYNQTGTNITKEKQDEIRELVKAKYIFSPNKILHTLLFAQNKLLHPPENKETQYIKQDAKNGLSRSLIIDYKNNRVHILAKRTGTIQAVGGFKKVTSTLSIDTHTNTSTFGAQSVNKSGKVFDKKELGILNDIEENDCEYLVGIRKEEIVTYEKLQAANPVEPIKKTSYVQEAFSSDLVPFTAFLEKNQKKLSVQDQLAVAEAINLSIAELHDKMGLKHGDVKPDNFLFKRDRFGQIIVKLADFGFCKKFSAPHGTVYYDPPDNFVGGNTSPAYHYPADYYAGGLVMRELSQQKPFSVGKNVPYFNVAELQEEPITSRINKLESKKTKLNSQEKLELANLKLLRRDPKDRATCETVAKDISEILDADMKKTISRKNIPKLDTKFIMANRNVLMRVAVKDNNEKLYNRIVSAVKESGMNEKEKVDLLRKTVRVAKNTQEFLDKAINAFNLNEEGKLDLLTHIAMDSDFHQSEGSKLLEQAVKSCGLSKEKIKSFLTHINERKQKINKPYLNEKQVQDLLKFA